MAGATSIEWTEATWNPVRGCTKVSAGCKHCYAEAFAERWRGVAGHPYERGFDLRLVPEALELPLRWRKPRRIFVNSMSDLFHEDVPNHFIRQVFEVIAKTPQHTYQVLTKRAARMREFMTAYDPLVGRAKNAWLGVSVEDQAAADERIPHLLATPAAIRFLSCEPLLGAVDLTPYFRKLATSGPGWKLTGGLALEIADRVPDWVIVGGESGPGARCCDLRDVREIVRACRAAAVPCFVKQLGAHPIAGHPADVELLPCRDRKGGDPAEWPEDLRVRETPEVSRG